MHVLKSRAIHTCSNSELYNMVIIHRTQDNNFRSIVLYVWLLYISKISSQVWLQIHCFSPDLYLGL